MWQVKAVIEAKRINLTEEEACDVAKRTLSFKKERGRLPSITSPDPWEKHLAEGVAFLAKSSDCPAIGAMIGSATEPNLTRCLLRRFRHQKRQPREGSQAPGPLQASPGAAFTEEEYASDPHAGA